MNPHALTEALRLYLTEELPEATIHTPVNCGELAVPYVLVSSSGASELIAGNHAWELTIAVELRTSAYDTPEEGSRDLFSKACSVLTVPTAHRRIEECGHGFYLYALRLQTLEEPVVDGNDFTQQASFRAVVQY